MKPAHLLLALSLVTPALQAAGDDELQQLRDENAKLKAQIENMKQQPAQGATGTQAGGTAGGTSTTGPRAGNAAAATGQAGMQAYNGIDLSETGCRRGGLDYGPDDAWKEQPNWDSLRRSMSTKEVEQWLGKLHFVVKSKDRLMWQYGKCGDTVQGYVVFEGDSLIYWKTPDF